MMNKPVLTILIIVFILCLPFLFGVFEANVGPQANSVGVAQLRTATGSNASSCTAGVLRLTMNDYNFFPSISNTGATSSSLFTANTTTDPANTLGLFMVDLGVCVGTVNIRWRYITTTDSPYWWVCVNAVGLPVSTWVSDDPPNPTFTGSPIIILTALRQVDPTVTCRQITSGDIQGLNLPLSSYVIGDNWIREHGYSLVNRDFRALQHVAGMLAPSLWIHTHLKLSGNGLVPQTVLPLPINMKLP